MITEAIVYRCDRCEARHATTEPLYSTRARALDPERPPRWREINGLLLCPEHTVDVYVDGVRTP